MVASRIFFMVLLHGVREHTQDGGSSDLRGSWGLPPAGSHSHSVASGRVPYRPEALQDALCVLLRLRFRDLGSSNDFQLEIQPWT